MRDQLNALADRWDLLAETFHAMGSDISIAEAASMRNNAKELRALLDSGRPLPSDWVAVPEQWLIDVGDATAALGKRGDRQMAARLMALHREMAAAPSAPAEVGISRDRCTDPDNCRRCSEDASTPHAGIPRQTAPEPLAQGPACLFVKPRLIDILHKLAPAQTEHRVMVSTVRDAQYTEALYASPRPAAEDSAALIDHMVTRFLGWKLPTNFHPDGGITFAPRRSVGTEWEAPNTPVGTNLLNAEQAKEMFLYCIEGLEGREDG